MSMLLFIGSITSLLAIVTRISRTDYNVTYKLRDARAGAASRPSLRVEGEPGPGLVGDESGRHGRP